MLPGRLSKQPSLRCSENADVPTYTQILYYRLQYDRDA